MITTERLVLRKPRREDAADLAVAYADPEVVRFIGDGSTATLTEVEERHRPVAGALGELGHEPVLARAAG